MLSPNAESASAPAGNETQLLVSCARTRVSSQMAERIHAIARGNLDWKTFHSGANDHAVLPLVYSNLVAVCPEDVPDEWLMRFRADALEIAQRNLFLTAEMLRLSGRFRAEGLTAIPYKGPLLAAEAYGNLALRQFEDLDFAIRQRDIPRAQELVFADGYTSNFGNLSPDEHLQPTHSEYQFVRAMGHVVVELQTEATLRYYPRPLDFDLLSNRLKHVTIGGEETFSFSPEDALILVAVHGTKHFLQRLLWIADIAEIVQAPSGMDWSQLFARAAEMQVGRVVHLALYVAHHLLQAPLPGEVLRNINADRGARKLGREICRSFSIIPEDPPVFRRFRFRVASGDSFWRGMRHAVRLATLPTDPDRRDLRLPPRFSSVHKWIRPFLLAKRYGVRRSKPRETP